MPKTGILHIDLSICKAEMEVNMGEIRIALQSLKMSIQARMQYRVDTLVASLAVFIRESANIIAIYLALLKFDQINGWNVNEMLFLYSILFLTYAFVVALFADLRQFSDTIREGRFDRLLVRPRSLLVQLILNNADLIAAAGHGTLGILLFVISAGKVGIHWNFTTILYYIGAIISGILIQKRTASGPFSIGICANSLAIQSVFIIR